jgi:hypothetical protein
MMTVLLVSETFWKSFITTDYVRKIITPFLVVEFNWGFLSPFKFLRFFVVLVLLGMGVLPTDTEPMFIKEVELPGYQQERSGCRVSWAFPVVRCQPFVNSLTVGPDGDMWGVLVVESHLSQLECRHHCRQFHLICVCANSLAIGQVNCAYILWPFGVVCHDYNSSSPGLR